VVSTPAASAAALKLVPMSNQLKNMTTNNANPHAAEISLPLVSSLASISGRD
jgi:hypothetical protein